MLNNPWPFRVVALNWWFVLPLAIVALLGALVWVSIKNYECRSFCKAKGFPSARFTPAGRANTNALCHCLTKEESEFKRRVPKGTEVYPWGQ